MSFHAMVFWLDVLLWNVISLKKKNCHKLVRYHHKTCSNVFIVQGHIKLILFDFCSVISATVSFFRSVVYDIHKLTLLPAVLATWRITKVGRWAKMAARIEICMAVRVQRVHKAQIRAHFIQPCIINTFGLSSIVECDKLMWNRMNPTLKETHQKQVGDDYFRQLGLCYQISRNQAFHSVWPQVTCITVWIICKWSYFSCSHTGSLEFLFAWYCRKCEFWCIMVM